MPYRLVLLSALLFAGTLAQAQQPAANGNTITLDAVVTPRSGVPVPNLQQGDFTLLDNKATRSLTSLKAFTAKQEPAEVVLVVDAVNTTFQNVAFERDQIDRFLRANGGHLAHPTALTIFTDTAQPGTRDEETLDVLGSWAATTDTLPAARATSRTVDDRPEGPDRAVGGGLGQARSGGGDVQHGLAQQRDRLQATLDRRRLVGDHQLVGRGALSEGLEVFLHVVLCPEGRVREHLVHMRGGPGGEQLVGLVVGHVEVADAELAPVEADGSSASDAVQLLLSGG